MIVCPSISNPKPELDSSGHSLRFNLETASTEARSRQAALVVGAGRSEIGIMATDTMHESHLTSF